MDAVSAPPSAPPPSFENLSDGLEQYGFAVQTDALPHDVTMALNEYAARIGGSDFHAAAVGRGFEELRNRFVRRDLIHWMDERNPALASWREWTESLRIHLNRKLFLGLFSFESHVAHYRPGDFYRTHVDAFKGEANRLVSLVCYLNDSWKNGDGGELVMYTDLGAVTVPPVQGTVVLFLSEQIQHEVKPALRDRYSVTGWYRLNSSSPDRIDPPR